MERLRTIGTTTRIDVALVTRRVSILKLHASMIAGEAPAAAHGDERPVLEIRRSALIERSTESAFDVIEAAEHYPAFLPWCADAVILDRSDDLVAARIAVDYRGVRFSFTTRNPKERPRWLQVRLVEGPFRRFEGEWHLKALAPTACKIEFDFRYEFRTALLAKLAGPVFNDITSTLVDAFARRVLAQPVPPSPQALAELPPRDLQ